MYYLHVYSMNGEFIDYIHFCVGNLDDYETFEEIYNFIGNMANEIYGNEVFIIVCNYDTVNKDFVKEVLQMHINLSSYKSILDLSMHINLFSYKSILDLDMYAINLYIFGKCYYITLSNTTIIILLLLSVGLLFY